MIVKANKETIKNFQKHLCMMLDSIIDIFDKYDLQWFADSGTLLGAVRDGKIIDWDNDIDIVLPIKDYIKFLEVAKKELPENLHINNIKYNKNAHKLHTTIVDKNTTFLNIFENYTDMQLKMMIDNPDESCILIDIYGIEHVPEKHTKMFKEYVSWTNFMQNYLCHRWKHLEMYNVIDSDYSLQLHNFYINTLLKIDEAFKNSKYMMCHNCVAVTKYEDLQLEAKWYDSYVEVDFEGLKHKLRLPVGYKEILFTTYGSDYMTPIQAEHVGSIPYSFAFDVEKAVNVDSVEMFRKLLKNIK